MMPLRWRDGTSLPYSVIQGTCKISMYGSIAAAEDVFSLYDVVLVASLIIDLCVIDMLGRLGGRSLVGPRNVISLVVSSPQEPNAVSSA